MIIMSYNNKEALVFFILREKIGVARLKSSMIYDKKVMKFKKILCLIWFPNVIMY